MKSESKLIKSDLKKDFEKVVFKSFSHEEKYEYSLFNLDESKKKLVMEYINNINVNADYYLYYRGDSFKKFGDNFDYIVNQSLNKYFIVGFKGADFYKNESRRGFYNPFHIKDPNDLKKLIRIIKARFPSFAEEKLEEYPDDKLDILHALIHISGKEGLPEEKENSPLVSVAVGDGNFIIAKEFSNVAENSYGFIILGFEKIGKYYIDSEILEEFNVQDKDIIKEEQEMMIKNALWPSNIIGIFALTKNNHEKSFIVNPWLLNKFESDSLRESYLIDVNQVNFPEFSEDLGNAQYSIRPY